MTTKQTKSQKKKTNTSSLTLMEVYQEDLAEERQLLTEIEFEDPLMQIFIRPFTDIFDTARAGLEKIAATAWTHLASLTKQAVYLCVPFLSTATMDSIQKNAEEKVENSLAAVDAKYGPVLERVYDTMKDRDLWGTAFLFNPALYMGFKVGTLGPQAALSALEALTGGNKTIIAMKEKLALLNQRRSVAGSSSGDEGFGWDDYDIGGFGFSEAHTPKFDQLKKKSLSEIYFQEQQVQQQPAPQVQRRQPQQRPQQPPGGKKAPTKEEGDAYINKQILAALKRPEVQHAMKSNRVAVEMRKLGAEAVMATATEIAALKTYEDYKKYFGDEFKKFEQEFNKTVGTPQSPEQEQEFKKNFIPQLRKSVLDMYAKQVTAMAGKFPETGKELNDIAAKIRTL